MLTLPEMPARYGDNRSGGFSPLTVTTVTQHKRSTKHPKASGLGRLNVYKAMTQLIRLIHPGIKTGLAEKLPNNAETREEQKRKQIITEFANSLNLAKHGQNIVAPYFMFSEATNGGWLGRRSLIGRPE